MPTNSSSFYASAPLRALFAEELAALAPILGGVYGNFGLFLRPHHSAPAALPPHLLGSIIDLAIGSDQQLHGRLHCAPEALPLVSESCKLLIAQHVLERVDEPAICAEEFARVLAPEGVALVLGFNPVSLWRPWLAPKTRRAQVELHWHSAQHCQHHFARHGVEILQTRYIGAMSPWTPAAQPDQGVESSDIRSALFGRARGSWLLLARKRRSVLTPLRLRRSSRELALNPRLAPGAHRQCA